MVIQIDYHRLVSELIKLSKAHENLKNDYADSVINQIVLAGQTYFQPIISNTISCGDAAFDILVDALIQRAEVSGRLYRRGSKVFLRCIPPETPESTFIKNLALCQSLTRGYGCTDTQAGQLLSAVFSMFASDAEVTAYTGYVPDWFVQGVGFGKKLQGFPDLCAFDGSAFCEMTRVSSSDEDVSCKSNIRVNCSNTVYAEQTKANRTEKIIYEIDRLKQKYAAIFENWCALRTEELRLTADVAYIQSGVTVEPDAVVLEKFAALQAIKEQLADTELHLRDYDSNFNMAATYYAPLTVPDSAVDTQATSFESGGSRYEIFKRNFKAMIAGVPGKVRKVVKHKENLAKLGMLNPKSILMLHASPLGFVCVEDLEKSYEDAVGWVLSRDKELLSWMLSEVREKFDYVCVVTQDLQRNIVVEVFDVANAMADYGNLFVKEIPWGRGVRVSLTDLDLMYGEQSVEDSMHIDAFK